MSADREYLAVGLALGGLSEGELAEARALAASDPEFRAEVAAYADTAALMAMSDGPETVSAETEEAILSVPDTVAQEDPAATASSVPAEEPIDLGQRRRRAWLPWAAAAAAVVLVVAGFGVSAWQMQERQNDLEETLANTQQRLDETTRLMNAADLKTTTAQPAGGGSVTVISSEAEQIIRVSARGVEPAQGTSLQMWVIGEEGPQSAGLMVGDVANIHGSAFSAGSQFGITVEPEGGSPQPTSDPIVAVEL